MYLTQTLACELGALMKALDKHPDADPDWVEQLVRKGTVLLTLLLPVRASASTSRCRSVAAARRTSSRWT
jgi:hypothetical protein